MKIRFALLIWIGAPGLTALPLVAAAQSGSQVQDQMLQAMAVLRDVGVLMQNDHVAWLADQGMARVTELNPDDLAELPTFSAPIGDMATGVTALHDQLLDLQRTVKPSVPRPSNAIFPGAPPNAQYPLGCGDTAANLSVLVAKQVADGLLAATEFVCSQEVPAVPNVKFVLCMVLRLVDVALSITSDQLGLCGNISDADVQIGLNDRFTHLHGNVEVAEVDLTNRANAVDASVAARDADLLHRTNVMDATVDDLVNTARAQAAQRRAAMLSVAIEEAFTLRRPLAMAMLPAAQGGHLETAREITVNMIESALAAGRFTTTATMVLARGDEARAGGLYTSAYYSYQAAYLHARP